MSVRNSGHYIEAKIDEFFHKSNEIGKNREERLFDIAHWPINLSTS